MTIQTCIRELPATNPLSHELQIRRASYHLLPLCQVAWTTHFYSHWPLVRSPPNVRQIRPKSQESSLFRSSHLDLSMHPLDSFTIWQAEKRLVCGQYHSVCRVAGQVNETWERITMTSRYHLLTSYRTWPLFYGAETVCGVYRVSKWPILPPFSEHEGPSCHVYSRVPLVPTLSQPRTCIPFCPLPLTFYSLLVTWCTNSFSTTVRSAHTVFMCFVFIWEQTATCATYSIN